MKWMIALLSSVFLTLSISTAYAGIFDFFNSTDEGETVEESSITIEEKSTTSGGNEVSVETKTETENEVSSTDISVSSTDGAGF